MQLGEEKQQQWARLSTEIHRLLKQGKKGLQELSGEQLTFLMDDYQALVADLARARSLGAPASIVKRLNRIAVAGHILLYGHLRKGTSREGFDWWGAFPRAVRDSLWAVLLSAAIFFGAGVLSCFAVQISPSLGYEIVPAGFLEFDPARSDNLHDIPSLARPVVSSAIVANNIQVTLLAFGFGLTAGIGTTWLLLMNGIHIGAITGWMMLHGKGRALWGWIMPHGGTELMAICLAGAAGYLLAAAIVSPGQWRRTTALKRTGGSALVMEIGCMAMLVIAGLIEGFVSPSSVGFEVRIVILAISVTGWVAYFSFAGRKGLARTENPERLNSAAS